uniref:Uncharacterized protein n=1 Tax=Oryza brachyantha TaxID=4533 RepID=J3MR19_ORYBR
MDGRKVLACWVHAAMQVALSAGTRSTVRTLHARQQDSPTKLQPAHNRNRPSCPTDDHHIGGRRCKILICKTDGRMEGRCWVHAAMHVAVEQVGKILQGDSVAPDVKIRDKKLCM